MLHAHGAHTGIWGVMVLCGVVDAVPHEHRTFMARGCVTCVAVYLAVVFTAWRAVRHKLHSNCAMLALSALLQLGMQIRQSQKITPPHYKHIENASHVSSDQNNHAHTYGERGADGGWNGRRGHDHLDVRCVHRSVQQLPK